MSIINITFQCLRFQYNLYIYILCIAISIMYFIDRRSSSSIPGQFESIRKRNRDDSVSRRGSFERGRTGYERRGGSPDDYGSSLDNFRPVTLTVSSFFKQVSCYNVITY